MFVTFYSYKGGVGRSLALANIACLLAEDEKHPQRVLLWDFDLEAPGLHKLFPPKKPVERGFVQLAHQFATSNTLPDPADFIYSADVPGIDVLPAGNVDEEYCQMLQQINWVGFFGEEAPDRGDFFGPLVAWMQDREYDYVLIDSRTGLSDVAGICTQVLSDLLLIIFRLTDQDLDGVAHLVPAIRAQLAARKRDEVRILPVASCVPSRSSKQIHKKRDEARRIFEKTRDLSCIRFDPELVGVERLFCRQNEKEHMWPIAPIVSDYERLCGAIRQRNSEDTQTAMRFLQRTFRSRSGEFSKAEDALVQLLRRRPNFSDVWNYLRRFWDNIQHQEKLDRIALEVLDADATNSFGHEWVACKYAADVTSSESKELTEAKTHLELAIEHNQQDVKLHRWLAEVLACVGDLEAATAALRQAHELVPMDIQVAQSLADVYVRRGRDYFVSAAELLDKYSVEVNLALRLYLCAYLGGDTKAQEIEEALEKEDGPLQEWRSLILAHSRLLRGNLDEAKRIAEDYLSSHDNGPATSNSANWVEFFLCAEDFDRFDELIGPSRGKHGAGPAVACLVV